MKTKIGILYGIDLYRYLINIKGFTKQRTEEFIVYVLFKKRYSNLTNFLKHIDNNLENGRYLGKYPEMCD